MKSMRVFTWLCIFLLVLQVRNIEAKTFLYDVVIRNATVYDGISDDPYEADVAIVGDTITHIGEVKASEAAQLINARGMILAPGFIDVHTHSDFNPLIYRSLGNKIAQGVTTEVVGNCGMSAAPVFRHFGSYIHDIWAREGVEIPAQIPWQTFSQYVIEMEQAGLETNLAALIGHGNLRYGVMSDSQEKANDEQLAEMKTLLQEAMDQGAWGISYGLIYLPGIYADQRELVQLCEVAGKNGGLCAFHVRNEGRRVDEAIQEALQIGKEADSPVQLSHLKAAAGTASHEKINKVFQLIEEARENGQQVLADAYPYEAGFAELGVALPDDIYRNPSRHALFDDPEKRAEIIKQLKESGYGSGKDWHQVVIASVQNPEDRQYEGQSIQQIAEAKSQEPVKVLVELLARSQFQVAAFYFSLEPTIIHEIINQPYVAIGSDSVADGIRHPHPRVYGTFTRVLKQALEQGDPTLVGRRIRQMTSIPARYFGMKGRGSVEVGQFADLVLFDPARVQDLATYENPTRRSEGIEWVFVNGEAAVAAGQATQQKAGRVLRKNEN